MASSLRISPITDSDLEPNSWEASAGPLGNISFRISILALDLGPVFRGDQVTLHIEHFLTLPLESLQFRWELEGGVPLAANMKVAVSSAMERGVLSLLRPMCHFMQRAHLSTSAVQCCLQKLSRLRVVDNSALGRQAMMDAKPPKIIHVYNKTGTATIGDKVLLAILGQKKQGYVVGCKHRKHVPLRPRFDTNNVVLLDDNGNPMGTRILVPLPSMLRGDKARFSKIIALCSRFV
ncbi:ribosomal protein L14, putative [Ixodes scapularis]|uniref:Large ribosomal subunit protein uL14m n=1 Tax=Ixodes scapularis TaxID=6945 RepID=B7QHZ8_IXOSC|nr:ribosomal protein L14, putative [Ixodes scapularis]|eukprot:XP_002414805.1 ribosomal protein L14, putative [Ixodes scapularis]